MSNQRQLRAVIPVLPDMDLDQVRWHSRESFETTAAADGLTVVDFTESTVPVDALPTDPRTGAYLAAERLDRPLAEYTFYEFVATVERPEADTSSPRAGTAATPPTPTASASTRHPNGSAALTPCALAAPVTPTSAATSP